MTTAIAKTKTKSNSKPKSKPPKPFSLKALIDPPKQDWTIAKPIIVDKKGEIIDGFCRQRVCEELSQLIDQLRR